MSAWPPGEARHPVAPGPSDPSGTSHAGTAGARTPGAGTPGAGTPGAGTAGAGSPGAATPGSGHRRDIRRWRPRLPAGNGGEPERPCFIVCGDDPLAHRLCDELITRYHAAVTAILPSRQLNHGPQIAALIGTRRVIEATRLDRAAFHAAGIRSATAVALVHQDDVGNIHAALLAREMRPGVRVVLRMFNMSLGHGIRPMLGDCGVLSDADMAAPAFVAAALGEVAPNYVRLPGRTLYVTRRADAGTAEIVCGLADLGAPGAPGLLPDDPRRADLVLAVASGAMTRPATAPVIPEPPIPGTGIPETGIPETGIPDPGDPAEITGSGPAAPSVLGGIGGSLRGGSGPARTGGRRRRYRRSGGRLALLGYLGRSVISRNLRLAMLALVAVLVGGTVLLSVIDPNYGLGQAVYITVLTAVGGVNPDLKLSGLEQLTQTLITLAGVALIPVVTAAAVDAVINARLALAAGGPRHRISGHVVVVGLGNVGTRVIRTLHDLGVPVVAVDRQENARGVQIARDLGIPLVIGDASRSATLRAASVQTCRALLVVSTDDMINLEAALHSRSLNGEARVVLRLFDGDFADLVQRAFGVTVSRSVSYLAAPAFAASMMDRDILGTIPIGRRVLLIAEVPVFAGSALDGAVVAGAVRGGLVRVIAVVDAGDRRLHWGPPPDRRLRAGDRLVVVARRAGLSGLLARGTAPTPPGGAPGQPRGAAGGGRPGGATPGAPGRVGGPTAR